MSTHPLYPAITTDGKITVASKVSALIFVIILPTIAALFALVLIWKRMVTWTDIAILVGMYVATGIGSTVGYHRLFTHRSFETYGPIRYGLALLGCMNAQGAPIVWASQHRQHHALSDAPGDPHSPHVERKPGFLGALKSLWHSHYGHVFNQVATIDPSRYAPDLEREAFLRWMEKWAALVVIAGFLIPGGIGYLVQNSWMGFFSGVFWGGFIRLFVITHGTGAVNSICHFVGYKNYVSTDEATNVWWLMPITLGESWHANHHAFPTSARHGLRWWEIDPSAVVIVIMEKIGLIGNVIRISPERLKERTEPRKTVSPPETLVDKYGE